MPYTAAQIKLFRGVKHGTIKKKDLSPGKAAKMLAEVHGKATKTIIRKGTK